MADAARAIKCIVWDLDNTVWDGTLLEDGSVSLRQEVADLIRALDARGVLHSIASRSDEVAALAELKACALDEYFLCPQINWGPKASSIETIGRLLDIPLDAVAFVDDDPFEREAVAFAHPAVLCVDGRTVRSVADLPLTPDGPVTGEARMRRMLYRTELRRRQEEETFAGAAEDFCATLNLVLRIAFASDGDLDRAEELTRRTHQLNSTGVTYSQRQLDELRRSATNRVLVTTLEDRFGTYGLVGLVLIETSGAIWTIKLLLTSCRVASRGVGGILLRWLMRQARAAGVALRAEFLPNDRNRIMDVTFRLAGFRECGRRGDVVILETPLTRIPPIPDFVRVQHPPRLIE